jgi:hypothetical protein
MIDDVIQLLPRFIEDLNRLQPEYSYADRIWQLPMRTGEKPKNWAMVFVTHYQDTYYFSWTKHRLSLQIDTKGKLVASENDHLDTGDLKKLAWALEHFHRKVTRIEKDWVSVYRETVCEYPLAMRYGIVPQSIVWKYYPDTYRVDVELGKKRVAQFIALTRDYKFREEFGGHHKKMTLGLFMRPIEVSGADDFVLRLLGMDNVGLIPDYRMNHRASQDFESADKVFDCAHLHDLPRYNRILPFVTWKALAPLRPLAA